MFNGPTSQIRIRRGLNQNGFKAVWAWDILSKLRLFLYCFPDCPEMFLFRDRRSLPLFFLFFYLSLPPSRSFSPSIIHSICLSLSLTLSFSPSPPLLSLSLSLLTLSMNCWRSLHSGLKPTILTKLMKKKHKGPVEPY